MNGFETKVLLDTGYHGLLWCPQEKAAEFQVKMERLEEPVVLTTPYGELPRHFAARDVPVELLGKKVAGEVLFNRPGDPVIVGMEVLRGARITLFESGDWDITFPART